MATEALPAVVAPARRGFLSPRERRTVEAFAEVFIEGDDEVITPAEIAANVDRQLARMRTKRTRSLRLVLLVVEYLLPLLSARTPFSRLRPEARRALIERHVSGPRAGRLGRQLAKIRVLFLAGYYGDERVQRRIGFRPVPERPRLADLRPRGRATLSLKPLAAPGGSLSTQLCVIGSGAGGAVVAARAAAAGVDVVVLEEGPYVPASALSHDEGAMTALLYKEGGLQSTVDLGMSILQGRAVGGTTLINNAICFRLDGEGLHPGAADVLEEWREIGAHVDRAALEQAFGRVERRLRVAPIGPEVARNNAAVLLEGWERLAARDPAAPFGRFAKNFDGCEGCGFCNFGCPYERKLSTLETYLADADRDGARIVAECHAERIVEADGRARAVLARRADGSDLEVRADAIVVAGGAIGSSVLLMRSRLAPNAGSRFSFNAATPVLARFPWPVHGWDGDQMGAYVDLGDVLLESSFDPPLAYSATVPGWFRTHYERMLAYDHLASTGVVVASRPTGHVKRHAFLRDWLGPVAWRMPPDELARMRRGMTVAASLYFAAGAEVAMPSTFTDAELDAETYAGDPERIARRLEEVAARPEDLLLSSAHPQGGNPMSDDRRIGVVGSDFRVHGLENLFVCDASVFPSGVRVNPALSIMALSDYAWERSIRAQLGAAA